jgi:hypothetical protein
MINEDDLKIELETETHIIITVLAYIFSILAAYSLIVIPLMLLGCSSQSEVSKEELLLKYRAVYGDNWDNWNPEVKEHFKKQMETK